MACPSVKTSGQAIRYKSSHFLRQAVGFSLPSLTQKKRQNSHYKRQFNHHSCITNSKMKKTTLLALLLVTVFATAQTPTYSKYTVKTEKVTAKEVNLKSHKEARMYRTNLKAALANSDVNFAGKYILTNWGCGSGCTQGAIINAHTGNAFFPLELQGVLAGGIELGNHDMLEYKKNSNLLIIYGYAGGGFNPETETQQGIYYYLWTGTKFKLLKFTKKAPKV